MLAAEEQAPCQGDAKGRVPIPGPPSSRRLADTSPAPASCPLRPRSPGCRPAGEELTPEVPAGLTVPAAAAAAGGRDEEAGAAWAPGALQSGGVLRGERAAGLGAAGGVRQGARRDGAGGDVWSGELAPGTGARAGPQHIWARAAPLDRGGRRAQIWSGRGSARLGPFEALGAHIWDLERGPRRAQLGPGRGAAAAQLARRGRGRSRATGGGEGREQRGTGAWDGAPEAAGARQGPGSPAGKEERKGPDSKGGRCN